MRGQLRATTVMLALATIAAIGAGLLWLHAFAVAPPQAVTDARMWVIKRRIIQFARANGTLPPALTSVPEMPGYDNALHDGWGNTISYSVGDNGLVTLTSLGSDRQAGGTGNAADLVGRFSPRTPAGAWADELDEWAVPPITRPTTRNKDQRVVP